MKCITTMAPLGASKVCVKTESGRAVQCRKEKVSDIPTYDHQGGHLAPGQGDVTEPEDCESDQECKKDGGDYR